MGKMLLLAAAVSAMSWSNTSVGAAPSTVNVCGSEEQVVTAAQTLWMTTKEEATTTSTEFVRVPGIVIKTIGGPEKPCLRIEFSAETTVPAGEAIEMRVVFSQINQKSNALPGVITWAKAGDKDQYSVVSFKWIVPAPAPGTGQGGLRVDWRSVNGAEVKLGKRTFTVDF